MSVLPGTEVLFYHLEKRSLEQVLPGLLGKCLERGWRGVLQAGSEERMRALDDHLWAADDAGFLPHGSASDGNAEHQPIFLTTSDENPNNANVRFYIDRAKPTKFTEYERNVIIFDGNDPEAVIEARELWAHAKDQGQRVQYWRQDERGRWQNQA